MALPNVAIIGTGAMGGMLLRASTRYSPGRFGLLAANNRPEPLERLRQELPALRTGRADEVAAQADIVVACVQPQHMLAVVDEVAPALRPGTIVVSITNGVALETIAARVTAPIVKVVPSVAHAVGRGVALMTPGPRSDGDDLARVRAFFAPFSRPFVLGPEDNRVATNVTGCGPALLACFARELARSNADRARAVTTEDLRTMLEETFTATAALLEAGTSLEDIARHAATGGGMTQVALETLEAELPDLLNRMVEATFQRERELQAWQGTNPEKGVISDEVPSARPSAKPAPT